MVEVDGKSALAVLGRAAQMLEEIRTIDDARDLMNLAEAARVYAKKIGIGLEAQNNAAEIKLRAQRKAGGIIKRMDKNKGAQGNPGGQGAPIVRFDHQSAQTPPTYEQIGIKPYDAHVWRKLYEMPEREFEAYIDEIRYERMELTTAEAYRRAIASLSIDGIETADEVEKPLHSVPMIDRYFRKQVDYWKALSELMDYFTDNPLNQQYAIEVLDQITKTQETMNRIKDFLRSKGGV